MAQLSNDSKGFCSVLSGSELPEERNKIYIGDGSSPQAPTGCRNSSPSKLTNRAGVQHLAREAAGFSVKAGFPLSCATLPKSTICTHSPHGRAVLTAPPALLSSLQAGTAAAPPPGLCQLPPAHVGPSGAAVWGRKEEVHISIAFLGSVHDRCSHTNLKTHSIQEESSALRAKQGMQLCS